jgi:hypothetical protein
MDLTARIRMNFGWQLLLLAVMVVDPAAAQEAAARARISEALRSALEKETPAVVEKRFLEALQSGNPEYVLESKELSDLAIEYMKKGDMERGQVVMAVAAQVAQIQAAELMPPGMAESLAAAAKAEREERAARPARVTEEELGRRRSLALLGAGRDDLHRFHGLYGRPEDNGNRPVFLVGNCNGHLLIGGQFGGIPTSALRSLGDTRFVSAGVDFDKPVHLEIMIGADGKPTRIVHDMTYIASPLLRLGDLPSEYEPRCKS